MWSKRSVRLPGMLCVWLMIAALTRADEFPETQTLTNAFRAGWLQFGIVSGRLTLDGSRGINVSTSSGGTERRDRLTVRMTGGDPMVDYELTAADQELTILVSSHNRVQFRRKPKGESKVVAIDFDQPASGPMTLRIVAKEQEQIYRGASLWHLVVLQPQMAKEHLIPMLKLFHRDWDLTKTGTEIESALTVVANDHSVPDKRRWAELVEQLGDSRFSKREAADRQLREVGRIVVTYLQQIDPSRLDAEQQFRVRRITAALSDSEGNDTPEQVAAWLAGDPAIWLALLSRDDPALRKLAAKQLVALLGGPIDFDPAADAATRARQIERLRPRVLAVK